MYRIIALLSLALFSCGDDSGDNLSRGTDAELREPVEWVRTVARNVGAPHGHKIDYIDWGVPPDGYVGYCQWANVEKTDSWGQTSTYPYRKIIVSRGYADVLLYTLVAHEMGHCAWDVQHSSDDTALMYPSLRYYDSLEVLEQAIIDMLSNVGLVPGED